METPCRRMDAIPSVQGRLAFHFAAGVHLFARGVWLPEAVWLPAHPRAPHAGGEIVDICCPIWGVPILWGEWVRRMGPPSGRLGVASRKARGCQPQGWCLPAISAGERIFEI